MSMQALVRSAHRSAVHGRLSSPSSSVAIRSLWNPNDDLTATTAIKTIHRAMASTNQKRREFAATTGRSSKKSTSSTPPPSSSSTNALPDNNTMAQQRTKDTTRHIKFLINNLPSANLPGEVVVDTLNEINTGGFMSLGSSFFNTLLKSSLDKDNNPENAIKLVEKLSDSGMKPNADTYTLLIDAALKRKNFGLLTKLMKEAAALSPVSFAMSTVGKNALVSPNLQRTLDPTLAIKLPEEESVTTIKPFASAEEARDRQVILEIRSAEQAAWKSNFIRKNVINLGKGANLKSAHPLTLEWYEPLKQAILQEQQDILTKTVREGKKQSGIAEYGPVLVMLPADKLAVLTISRVLAKVMKFREGVPVREIVLAIGDAVQEELEYQTKEQPGLMKKVPKVSHVDIGEPSTWTSVLKVKVGAVLLDMLIRTAQIPSFDAVTVSFDSGADLPTTGKMPAFEHTYKLETNNKTVGTIVANAKIYEAMDEMHSKGDEYDLRYLPMVIPPVPWTADNRGAYITLKCPIMRTKGSKAQVAALKSGNLTKVFQCLNILGSTAWKINKPILDVVDRVWQEGGGLGELPSKKDHPVPPPPDDYLTNGAARKAWKKEVMKIQQLNRDLHGLRCDTNLKLSVAHEFKDLESIYFPHNLDFRGRTYPIPPNLNHLGSDICRSLLTFSKGLPLGENGLRWMMIHLANLYGKSKSSFTERISFTKEHIDDILDSARKPLDGNRWWLSAEDPWQCLAACKELASALELKNPAEFVSHLPVHMDGSCNGLQHYAAMGGDELGAALVNLSPSDRPQDVYSGVAGLVAQRVAIDAEADHPIAKLIVGKVERKIVKQTVMTSVYGVTYVGAREQIQNALKDRGSIDEENLLAVANYLAALTLNAIKEMFLGAKEIMEWLAEAATQITKETKQPVKWVSPMGLPILQPYRNSTRHTVRTVVQDITLVSSDESLPVSSTKQRSAFPPNYVHSLDSSHMMKTAIECDKQGITFASVHDSFWSHACNADRLNEILRKEFVSLHTYPLLEDLLAQFQQQCPNIKFAPLPSRGNFKIDSVLSSPYFFH